MCLFPAFFHIQTAAKSRQDTRFSPGNNLKGSHPGICQFSVHSPLFSTIFRFSRILPARFFNTFSVSSDREMTGSPAESGRLCTIFRTPAGRQRSTGGSRDETRHRLCQCPAPSVSVPRSHTAARPGSRSVTLPPLQKKGQSRIPRSGHGLHKPGIARMARGEHTLPHRQGGRAVSHASCTPPLPGRPPVSLPTPPQGSTDRRPRTVYPRRSDVPWRRCRLRQSPHRRCRDWL